MGRIFTSRALIKASLPGLVSALIRTALKDIVPLLTAHCRAVMASAYVAPRGSFVEAWFHEETAPDNSRLCAYRSAAMKSLYQRHRFRDSQEHYSCILLRNLPVGYVILSSRPCATRMFLMCQSNSPVHSSSTCRISSLTLSVYI